MQRCCCCLKKTSKSVPGGRGELTSEAEKAEILCFIQEAKDLGVAEKTTCRFLGITPRTIQNWRSKGLRDRRKGCSRPTSKRALSQEEWDALYEVATSKRFADLYGTV